MACMNRDFGNNFLAHRPIPGVRFEHDDFVHVTSGEHKGKTGSLVSLNSLDENPRFTLELESGFDIEILQSEIERID
jgi:ribosomal protein S4E